MCDRPDVYRESIVRARKPYTCCECGWLIAVGEAHRYCWGVWDGGARDYRMCAPCYAVSTLVLSQDADACVVLGGLWEEVTENDTLRERPEGEAFIARVHYREALRWRDRELARAAERAQFPRVARSHEKQANKHAWEWIKARDALVAAGVRL